MLPAMDPHGNRWRGRRVLKVWTASVLSGKHRVANGWGLLAMAVALVPLVVVIVSLFTSKPIPGGWRWVLLGAFAALFLLGLFLLVGPSVRDRLARNEPVERAVVTKKGGITTTNWESGRQDADVQLPPGVLHLSGQLSPVKISAWVADCDSQTPDLLFFVMHPSVTNPRDGGTWHTLGSAKLMCRVTDPQNNVHESDERQLIRRDGRVQVLFRSEAFPYAPSPLIPGRYQFTWLAQDQGGSWGELCRGECNVPAPSQQSKEQASD